MAAGVWWKDLDELSDLRMEEGFEFFVVKRGEMLLMEEERWGRPRLFRTRWGMANN